MVSVGMIGRIAKAAGRLMVMDSKFCTKLEGTLANFKAERGYKNLHKSIWESLKAAENETKNNSFFKDIWTQVKSTPKDVKKAWKDSKGFWNTAKSVGSQIGKRLPLIFVAFEIPNIISAYNDKGIIGGTIEACKSLIRGASSMAGFAIGQTLIPIPILGGLVGAFATDFVVSKIIGKSHSEEKAEAEEAETQQYQEQLENLQQMQNNTPYGDMNIQSNLQPTMTPQQMMELGNKLYGGQMTDPMNQDFMKMTSGKLNYVG